MVQPEGKLLQPLTVSPVLGCPTIMMSQLLTGSMMQGVFMAALSLAFGVSRTTGSLQGKHLQEFGDQECMQVTYSDSTSTRVTLD
jgi:hypothetical protein